MLSAILIAVALCVFTVTVVELVILLFEQVVEWFNNADTMDIDAVCFTVLEAERAGQVTVIQGVLDRSTGTIAEGNLRRIKAQTLDPALAESHRSGKVVVYN